MRYVLDASVAACWYFEDEHDPRADAAAAIMLNGGAAIVPLIFWFEIRNVVLMGMRRGRTTEALMLASLAKLSNSSLTMDRLPKEAAIFTLAQGHRLTFYDAAYLELAKREDIPLATLDRALAKAATDEGVALLGA